MKFISLSIFISCIVTKGFSFVYDIEPSNPAKEYMLERQVFERTNDSWYKEFPSFEEWDRERDRAAERIWTGIKEYFREKDKPSAEGSLEGVKAALDVRCWDERCSTLEPVGELNSRD